MVWKGGEYMKVIKKRYKLILLLVAGLIVFVGLPIAVAKAKCYEPNRLAFSYKGNFSLVSLAREFSRIIFTPSALAFCSGSGGGGDGGGGTPSGPCDPAQPTDQCNHYGFKFVNGHIIHWPAGVAATGIHYHIKLGTITSLADAMASSFPAWQSASNEKIKFIRGDGVNITVDPLQTSDGQNTVSLGTVSNLTDGWYQDSNGHKGYRASLKDPTASYIIGATKTWCDDYGVIYEVDIVLNSGISWSVENPPPSDAYSVQNVMTHEIGHTLFLLDLYGAGESELTMYGYGTQGETKKISLGAGDISGVRALYP